MHRAVFLSKILLYFLPNTIPIFVYFLFEKRENNVFYTKFYISAADMMFFYRNQMLKSEKNQKLSISVLTPPTRPALRRKQETVAFRNLSFK